MYRSKINRANDILKKFILTFAKVTSIILNSITLISLVITYVLALISIILVMIDDGHGIEVSVGLIILAIGVLALRRMILNKLKQRNKRNIPARLKKTIIAADDGPD